MHRKVVALSFAAAAVAVLASGVGARSPTMPWRILLSSNREGDSEIYVVDVDGSGARRLTRSPGWDGFATWSFDRSTILYGGRAGAYVINPDGTGRRRMPAAGAWSPDGRRIVFSSNQEGNNEVYVVNTDGTEWRNLSQSPSSQEFSPAWSPDGRTIAFVSDRDGNQEIYAMDADGKNQRNLTKHPLRDGDVGRFALLWSPDGHTIAFTTNRDRNGPKGKQATNEIYLMNADGSGQHRLTRSPEDEALLAWSPDGRRLAFQRWPSAPRWAFFVMNADGRGVKKVDWALPGKKGVK